MKIIEDRLRVSASDVANFLACQQLTQLDLQSARGMLRPAREFDLGFRDLVRRGEEHERKVLEQFRADGHEIADLSESWDRAEATLAAIQAGPGVIYQGTLTGAGGGVALFGRPDFLVRADLLPTPDGESRPPGRHYEIVDAKLARTAKARAVLQTAFYSYLLAELQGTEPRWMHLALGNGDFVSYKVKDFAAYERQTRRRLEEVLAAGPPPGLYAEPVEHCAICRWSELCASSPHEGNTNASPEEASEVARLAERLAGWSWRDRDGAVRPAGCDGILVVTPYNRQIRAIQGALAQRGLTGFKVGTVDKFQGREAPVVIYSMATSSADEAPRGLEFLYDRHRLNVAASRARAMAIIVASPDLIRVSCRTPHQMTLANALCRAWEERG